LVAPAFQGLAQNLFRLTMRIDIGRVEKVDAAVDGNVHQTLCHRLIEAADNFPVTLAPNGMVPKHNSDTSNPDLPN
jgi:hypothetical protein